MLSKDELNKGFAKILRELREKRGLSKAKMADLLYMDTKTWSRYETGETVPSATDFVWIFSQLGETALPSSLRLLYPGSYAVTPNSDDEELRAAALHYIGEVATDRFIREWAYICFGPHGSNIEPQMQVFTAINHLPLEYRAVVADLVLSLYRMADSKGELVAKENILPDLELLSDGLNKAKESVKSGRSGYTTTIEEKK